MEHLKQLNPDQWEQVPPLAQLYQDLPKHYAVAHTSTIQTLGAKPPNKPHKALTWAITRLM